MMPRALMLSIGMLGMAVPAHAQADNPYQVFDTRPVITEGPYLVASCSPRPPSG